MGLAKKHIQELKSQDIGAFLQENTVNNAYIMGLLENLGRLPSSFNGDWLVKLLDNENSGIRFLAVKNLGKLKNDCFLSVLNNVAINDSDTNVRREAVSAIGRLRKLNSKEILFNKLKDEDPKVVCQAIRGLLVFKGMEEVDKQLKPLLNHQNEMVRQVIRKEYFSSKETNNPQKHTESYDYLKNIVVHGDTIETMKLLKDESVHLTFTSPPYYNARDYSIYPSYKYYLEFLRNVFQEVYRITKEGRFLLLNTSPVIVPRVSRSHSSKRYPIPFDIHHYLMEMGWEFIDDIIWEKPEASVKNRIGGFQQHRKPLGYKPNTVTEYIFVYRKSTEKLLDWNIHQYDDETVKESKITGEFDTTNVWNIDPCFDKVHSAVFPIELCKRVIQYYSYKNDLIFDPFGGSGTVGRTAKTLGRYFFLTEKDEKYFSYMKSKFSFELGDDCPAKFMSFNDFKGTIV
ncbi:MAG: HEAT repeat domain-containing protein [Spirochaetaceae bacterium]|jgi:DNA modification methylase|nr:HEAT repeat domain-containing protein [Spirochaetaceae bacterium]